MSITSGTNEISPILKYVIFKKLSCQHYYWRYYGPPAGIMSHYFQCHKFNHDKSFFNRSDVLSSHPEVRHSCEY